MGNEILVLWWGLLIGFIGCCLLVLPSPRDPYLIHGNQSACYRMDYYDEATGTRRSTVRCATGQELFKLMEAKQGGR